jgi:uncharacterized protein YbjQ (UPF0145 family)
MPKPFASTLSVAGFRAVRSAGFRPLRQVQGSSVYHVGWRRLPQRKMRRGLQPQRVEAGQILGTTQYFPRGWDTAARSLSEGMWTELEQQTAAFNEARRLALERLRDAAREAGAVAVVDLHIRRGRFGHVRRGIQFSALGTAIGADRHVLDDGQMLPLTNLSGAEFWKLVSAGQWPLGVVGGTSVLYIVSGYRTRWARTRFAPRSRRNQEYIDYTDGLNHARRLALAHVRKEARDVGAAGILALQLDLERHDPGLFAGERTDLVVAVHALGTAIAPIEQGSQKEMYYALDLGGR